ncbi:ATP-binding cassette domain-containing protein [Methanoplanus sp. FWC-SCC4]|uniref:Molybdate/tungstate import ATP-binding protein WtpC n=2 Tax=Methanochimaera problematica TaxID=2609417 RepID=A0AA97FEB2_9EURY|nr:ATP-binding cassette domain-containing protein [Methanoplanus sp. FWC-SCC4]
MIEFDDVSLTLGDFSLKNLTLEISKGDYYFVLGPSGAGKTVILEAIAGLHRPDSGRILIRGEDVSGIPPEKRKIALVYQDYSLFPHMSVYENIAFGLLMQKAGKEEVSKAVDNIMNRLGISHLRDRHPLTMSGGEQQRVALARSLVVNPDILLLDEPLSAMDPITREKFISDLRSLHKELGITIVQVTHSRDEVFALAEKVAVISSGKLEQEGTLNDVFRKPENSVVGRFIGIENVLLGSVGGCSENGGCTVDICGVKIRALCEAGDKKEICAYIRGVDVGIDTVMSDSPVSGSRNVLPGSVLCVNPYNSMYRVYVDCGFSLCSLLTEREVDAMKIEPGKDVYAFFEDSAVHLTGRD